MRALVLSEIPDADITTAVAANELALVWVDNYIVYGNPVAVVPLDTARASVPNLDCAVFRARHHPLPLAMEGDTSDVASMAVKRENCVWVAGFNVVKLDCMVASRREVAFIGRNA
jgi:hypothetical protein